MRSLALLVFMGCGCVIQHDSEGKVTTPTPKPTVSVTARPTLPPPIPTMAPPTPEPTTRPANVIAPRASSQCEKILVIVKGPYKKDDVVIWAEKTHHIGRMFFDDALDQKYLGVKLNTPGERILDIKINGQWALSHQVKVSPMPDNCNIK